MTIITNFSGNLGNHIFSYALTRSIAENNGYGWGFNPKPEFDYFNGAEQLNIFYIDYGEDHSYSYYALPPGYTAWYEQHFDQDNYSYHPYQPEVFDVQDNTKLFIRCCQDARYFDKEKCRTWFQVKEAFQIEYPYYNQNHVVMNVRGGEYKGIKELLLEKSYWDHAIQYMQERVEDCHFLVISDDLPYAQSLFPEYECKHYSIGTDYWIIQNAQNLILSNSSFAIMPAWLNQNVKNVIAPKYWSRCNISNGYWANSDLWTFGFTFLDKNGNL